MVCNGIRIYAHDQNLYPEDVEEEKEKEKCASAHKFVSTYVSLFCVLYTYVCMSKRFKEYCGEWSGLSMYKVSLVWAVNKYILTI